MGVADLDGATVEAIAGRLGRESRLLVITGAGMSADSGLPTYRGIGGLYEAAGTEEGVPIEEALSGRMLRERPKLCWKYLAQIGRAAFGGRPNRGHEVLAEMEGYFAHVCVVTQNVDGYHQQAGSRNVIDLHGDMHWLICTGCGWRGEVARVEDIPWPPVCRSCGAGLRPEVVLFGEPLPAEKLARLQGELESGFDAVFSVGTTGVFPYIAEPIVLARELGWMTVEINPALTRVSDLVEYRLAARAAEALAAIWDRCRAG